MDTSLSSNSYSRITNFPNRYSWLPVVEDQDEASHIYGYFCDLIQANHPIILGANNCNLPRIVAIIAEAFEMSVILATSEQGVRMVNILKQVETNKDVFHACIAALNAEQREALEIAYRDVGAAAAAAGSA